MQDQQIDNAKGKEMTNETSNAEIDCLKNRIEKLQNALRWICGSDTVQYDENHQIDYVRMNWKYRDLAKRTLEGDYWKDDPVYEPKSIQKTLYINIGENDVYVEAFSIKAAADYWANYRVKKPVARLMVDVEYNEGDGVDD